jgi:hypothetical protein
VPVSIASRYILRYVGLTDDDGVGIFNSASAPMPDINYPVRMVSPGSGTLVTYDDSGFEVTYIEVNQPWRVFLGDTVYVRRKLGTSWGRAIEVTLGIDTTVIL